MRVLSCSVVLLFLVGCSSGDSVVDTPPPTACSNDEQKQFVLNSLYDWYLWNDQLPANINIDDYASPEELAFEVTTTYGPQDVNGNPVDRWSRVGSAEADQQFYGEGRYEGLGFRSRFEGVDLRIVSVYADSPVAPAGLERGQTILSINGTAPADIGDFADVSAFLRANDPVTFELRRLDGSTFTTAPIARDIVTIDPIPRVRVIDMGPGVPPVGYMLLESFISTAHDGQGGRDFDDVFALFIANGVRDVVLDLRYNRGGLVSTTELLGDYLGGFANDGFLFSSTEYNADRAAGYDTSSFFARLGNSIDLTRVIVIASTDNTASASELITNSMIPYADVWIVGENTYGKPVGQVGLLFCDKILRPTAFRMANADGNGDYFGGLPVDCPATDNLDIPLGDDLDENIIVATTISATGACPVAASPGGQQAPIIRPEIRYPALAGPPEMEFAGSF